MFDKLQRALMFLSGRTDLIVAILMLVAIAMIIIPLPTWLVDVLIAMNIMLSMLVLLVVFYIEKPVEFSSFPSVILILTLFRLAITITTARLILLQKRLAERAAPIRIEKTGRGQFRLAVSRPLQLSSVAGSR